VNRFTRARATELERSAKTTVVPDTRIVVQTSDSWSARLSYWAQVATLAVVIFGYFYTVRPAFQNQLLQEQAAQLTLDNQAATDKLKSTQALQSAAENDLLNLRTQHKELEDSLAEAKVAENSLQSELNKAQFKTLAAASSTARAVAELKSNQNAVEEEQRRTLMLYIAALVFAGRADEELADVHSYLEAYSNRFERDADGSFITAYKGSWPNAFDDIQKTLESAKNKSASGTPWVSKEIADEYEHRLAMQREAFTCVRPDLDAMKSKFLTDIANLEPGVERSLQDEVAKMKSAERNPLARIGFRVEPHSAEQFKQVRRLEGIGQLASDARAEIVKLHRECRAKEMTFFELFQDVKK
jgi:hypothetical protein